MDMQQISHMARMLINAHGDQAQVAAARRQNVEERRGNQEEAENWQKIRKVLSERRGPRES